MRLLASHPSLPTSSFLKHLKKIFFLIGIAIFGYLIYELGWENISRSLLQMGWWWIPIFCLAIVWQISHTLAWRQILRGLGHRPSVWQLIKLKFVAEAVNMVAPSANLGGDMARAYLIKKEVPITAGISSVMVDKTLDAFVKLFFNLIGLILTAIFIPVPSIWLWGGAVVLLVVFMGNSLMVLIQLKGFTGSVKKIARIVPPLRRKLEKGEDKLHDLAFELRRMYLKSPGFMFKAAGFHAIGRTLGLVEIWAVLQLLNSPVDFLGSYYIASIMNLVQSAFLFIPGQLGVAEGGQALLLETLGYTAVIGLSLGVIRRIRRLTLTGVGLLFYFYQKKEMPEMATETSTPSPEKA